MSGRRATRLLILHVPLLVLLLIALTACGGDDQQTVEPPDTVTPTELATDPTPMPQEPEQPITGAADVDEVSVDVSQDPLQVQVTATGNLPDGCTYVDDILTEREEDVFHVSITTTREADLVCTEALVPFEETFELDVADLPPGAYTVEVNDVSQSFEVPAAEQPTQEPEETEEPTQEPQETEQATAPPATISITPQSGPAGTPVQLTGIGLPENREVQIGIGPPESEFEVLDTVTTDAEGRLNLQINLPDYVDVGETWLFVANWDETTILSEPFSVTQAQLPGGIEGDPTRNNIYLVALEDAGESGELIGCEDSLVPVEVPIGQTIAPLSATLQHLLEIDSQFYGQSGLYNALYQSDLQIEGIDIRNRTAIIHLSGELVLGGACDAPRVEAQLTRTAQQFSTIDDADISINGTPLEDLLSEQ